MNLNSIATALVSAAIILYPIDLYRIEIIGLPLSIPRLLVLLSAPIIFISLFLQKFPKNQLTYSILALLSASSVLSLTVFRLKENDWFILLFFIALYLIITNLPRSPQTKFTILRSFELSYLLYIPFSIYAYYIFFKFGEPLSDIPFRDVIPLKLLGAGHLGGGFLVEVGNRALPRLSFPFVSPPMLGVAVVLGLLIFYYDKTLLKSKLLRGYRWTMLIALIFILFLTMSKAGVFTLFITLLVGATVTFRGTFDVSLTAISKKLLTLLVLAGGILALSVTVVFDRLFDWEVMENTVTKHIETRTEALSILLENEFNFLFGVGFGNYEFYGSGVHSHSTFTTILAELGVVGSLCFWLLFALVSWWSYLEYRKFCVSRKEVTSWRSLHYGIFLTNVAILVSVFAYEALYIWPTFIALGLSSIFSVDRFRRLR